MYWSPLGEKWKKAKEREGKGEERSQGGGRRELEGYWGEEGKEEGKDDSFHRTSQVN